MSKGTMQLLYSPRDQVALLNEVPRMMRDAEALRRDRVSPTADQRREIADEIWAFVRRRGRKVYGGHALNSALLDASPGDAIYSGTIDGNDVGGGDSQNAKPTPGGDIEFYSPNPVADVYELCDRLFAAGHRFVQGREAAHHGTFTVSVEFVRVCDVTYVPQTVYDRLPTVVRSPSGLMTVTPEFALIDHLRILCDPFTSHWKLDRMLPRMLLMQREFPVELPNVAAAPASAADEDHDDARHMVIETLLTKWVANRSSSVAIVGDHAAAFFQAVSSGAAPASVVAGRHLTLVSSDYATDLASLALTLGVDISWGGCAREGESDASEDAVDEDDGEIVVAPDGEEYYCGGSEEERCPVAPSTTLREYYPLIDLVGSRAEFRVHSGEVAVTLLDARGKAIPVCARCPRTGASVAGATYCVMTALSLRFADAIRCGDGHASTEAHGAVASAIVQARASYLNEVDKTVCDRDSVFREVDLEYIGEPLTDMRMHMAAADQRRLVGGPNAQVWFSYDPLRPGRHNQGKSRASHYQLMRCDGREVIDEVDSVLAMHLVCLRVDTKIQGVPRTL